MKKNNKVKCKKVIILTIIIFSTSVLISNAKIIKSLSVNDEIISGIEEKDNLNVEIQGEFSGRNNFMPGDKIDDDKIILANNEDFPVRFTLDLKKENIESNKYLADNLNLEVEGAYKVFGKDKYEVTVDGNSKKDIYSNVNWIESDIDIELAGAGTKNIYNISAEKSRILYESHFDSKEDLDGWIINRNGNCELSDKGMIIKGDNTYPEVYKENTNESNIFNLNGLEASVVLDLSELKNGDDRDGFNYFVALNNNLGEYSINFVFHVINLSDKGIYIFANAHRDSFPAYDSKMSKLIESNNNIFKFKCKILNSNGNIETVLSIYDESDKEIYRKLLTKDSSSLGQIIDPNKWKIENCGGFRNFGFDGVKSTNGIIVKSIELKKS